MAGKSFSFNLAESNHHLKFIDKHEIVARFKF